MFSWKIRVYYEDTDAGGVVYHSQYLNFLERARTEWLRALGIEQTELKNELGALFVVHSMQLAFKKPALFNDALDVQTRIVKLSAASLVFEQKIYRGEMLLINAEVKVACVDAQKLIPMAIPDKVKREILSVLVGS